MKTLEEVLYAADLESEEDASECPPYAELDDDSKQYYARMASAARAYVRERKKCTPGEALDALIAGRPVWRDGELFPGYDFALCDVEITFYPDDVWEVGV